MTLFAFFTKKWNSFTFLHGLLHQTRKKQLKLIGKIKDMKLFQGAAYTPYVRLLDPAYDDGINAVVGSLRQNRPNARLVSRSLLSSRRMIASNASSMLMQFGQFLSHDITKNKLVGRCTCSGGPECMIVALGREDRRNKNVPCIPIKRSVPVCATGTGNTPREQLNENTAFIDASMVYGSDMPSHGLFRAFRQADMQMIQVHGRLLPPLDTSSKFRTGDNRSNLFIGLSALHTVFVRYHNRYVGY
ncbi:unnamed protein product [Gongylonema pulchrum]|uniref:Animal hem peroxidase n=1 Tax=Gongylonema pulchrum TaxID=637853 RepID=A0A183D3P3_9BILA|nr:unnamed protein product [Gongylonema pulchrum]